MVSPPPAGKYRHGSTACRCSSHVGSQKVGSVNGRGAGSAGGKGVAGGGKARGSEQQKHSPQQETVIIQSAWESPPVWVNVHGGAGEENKGMAGINHP